MNAGIDEVSRDPTGSLRAMLVRQHELIEEAELARRNLRAEIAERKQVEEALRDSEERLRSLIDVSPQFVWHANADGALSFCNQWWHAYTGLSAEQTVGWGWVEAVHPDHRARLAAMWQHTVATGGEWNVEIPFRRSDGEYRWHLGRGTPIRDSDGRVIRWIGIGLDIHDRKTASDAVREAEERYRTVFTSMEQGFVLLQMLDGPAGERNHDYRYLEANPAFERQLGLADPVGKTIRELAPNIEGHWMERFGRVADTGDSIQFVEQSAVIGRWYDVYALRQGDPADRRVAVLFSDITERVRTEQRLRESEDRFKAMANAAPAMLWVTDPNASATFLSRAWHEYTGQTEAESLGNNGFGWLNAVHPDDREQAARIFSQANERREPFALDYRVRRADDEYRWAIDAGRPRFDDDGKFLGYVGSVIDVHERKQAEEQITRGAELLDFIIDRSPTGFYIVDADFRISHMNADSQARAFRNVNPAIGRRIDDAMRVLWPEPLATEIIAIFRHALDTGEPYKSPGLVSARADMNSVETYEWQLQRITMVDGRYAVVCYYYDTTRLREAEQALREADRRKDEFLATLAHELRNPLAPIRNSLHILRLTESDDGAGAPVHLMMERQLNHMVRLVDDLMEVSRITRGKVELRKQLVELTAVVRSAVEDAGPVIEAAGHQLAINLPSEPVLLEVDPVRLAQVLANLLNNAAKYTEAGGKIWLTARRETDQIRLSVRDTGTGIPAEMLPRVFDLFTQIDRTLGRAQGGLGIGLALVKSLVEMHGGTVEAQSDGPGRGSEFVLRLAVATTKSVPRSDANPLLQHPAPISRRILVVDDNHDAANSLAMLLRAIGMETQTAYDGVSALEATRAFRPSAVFLDIGMPGMDGYAVASQIRCEPQYQQITLIALTGWGQTEDKERARQAGFDHHMVKPPEVTALQSLLSSIAEAAH